MDNLVIFKFILYDNCIDFCLELSSIVIYIAKFDLLTISVDNFVEKYS